MTVIVTDKGFSPDDWQGGFEAPRALELAPDTNVLELAGRLDGVEMIRVLFPSFADGRGFTIARRLRLMGYRGRLRAAGHVIAEQYAMARRSGFDEVEIDDALARRQPEEQWLSRANWREHDHQSRLRG
ncbi:protein of unknown function [Meinhardsimonia xiamenensis]|jgi:uncharacterized protein (DUF934 family)|uniref:Oxidoreductase n=1 Tax=Meinhardsimonia xiamenensis TaxID=990712 RepID=A0A1G9F742_9RHOB|nr:DUF934 domain-containing protein [Meinhardsimonia xiamenensis]PRX37962.1 uncharacterized protein DUF934 [Meinhardsimonia xiamenensis]SDK84165.1 protein of unknown function [Meinhardsimonia xiamenensis]